MSMHAVAIWSKRIAAALALSWVAACARPLPAGKAPPWSTADADEGRRIYRAVCAGCHGEDGTGNTPVGNRLFPRPRDLTRGEFRFRSTASGKSPTREDLVLTLWRGLPGTAMPSWHDQLSLREMMSVVLYLEVLSPRLVEKPARSKDVIVQLGELEPPPSSPELIARGRELYEQMGCLQCHGKSGHGDGEAAPTLRNMDGARSHVFDFSYGRYKGGNRPIDFYRTVVTGLDGSPMPSYGDAIPDDKDRWAIVYYCLSLGRERGAWFYLTERPTWEEPIAP